MSSLITKFSLPPGRLADEVAATLFDLVINRFGWVKPRLVGYKSPDDKIEGDDAVQALVRFYAQGRSAAGKGKGGEFLLMSDRSEERTPHGYFAWFASKTAARNAAWRARHEEQCATVAKLLNAPLMEAGLLEEIHNKNSRYVPTASGKGMQLMPRVRGYHEGVCALFWRNIFGPPFTALMDDELPRLGSEVARDLGDSFWMVQPNAMPEDASTEEGDRSEAGLISKLGADLFYDMEKEQPPARFPTQWTFVAATRTDRPVAKPNVEAVRRSSSYILFQSLSDSPQIGLDEAERALIANGLLVLREGDCLQVNWGDDGPSLRIYSRNGVALQFRELIGSIDDAKRFAKRLKLCDSSFVIELSNLEEVLREANTLIEVHITLQNLTQGFAYNSWNGRLCPPS